MGLIPLEQREIDKDFSYSLEYKSGNPLNPFIKAVTILLLEPALIIVFGPWKTGKTDLGLLISELAIMNEVVHDVKTNIGQDRYNQITDFETLKEWLHGQGQYKDLKHVIKLYVFDELNVHAIARRSMTKKNVTLETILPEVSKAKARMLLLCQNPRQIDRILKDRTWLKGAIQKVSLRKANLFCPKVSFRKIPINGIPPTSIKFDPYLTAPMTLKPDISDMDIENTELRSLYMYARGLIKAKDIKEHPEQWNRFYRKWLRFLIEKYLYHTSQRPGGVIGEEKKTEKPPEDPFKDGPPIESLFPQIST
jgi:hypothetical protein